MQKAIYGHVNDLIQYVCRVFHPIRNWKKHQKCLKRFLKILIVGDVLIKLLKPGIKNVSKETILITCINPVLPVST